MVILRAERNKTRIGGMAEVASENNPQKVVDLVVSGLREGRNRAMQQRKAAIQKEFMIARRWVEDSYASFGPADLPVDVHRIQRDLAVLRDQIVDGACSEIDREYRIAVGVLKLVAEQHPGYYCLASDSAKQPKSWKRSLPPVAAPKIARVLPPKVLAGLNASHISQSVDLLLEADEGITFAQLASAMKLNDQEDAKLLEPRSALKQFCAYLREHGHVAVEGSGRGQKMRGTQSLQYLRDELIRASEA